MPCMMLFHLSFSLVSQPCLLDVCDVQGEMYRGHLMNCEVTLHFLEASLVQGITKPFWGHSHSHSFVILLQLRM